MKSSMTQEDKELLLKDLCTRLPYGIKCTTKLTGYNDVYVVQGVYEDNVFIDCPVYEEGDDEWMIESIIPFLRPMSSMTEEEQFQLGRLLGATSYNLLKGEYSSLKELLEYVYKNHIDLFGLIPKGLALEAPEGMYN